MVAIAVASGSLIMLFLFWLGYRLAATDGFALLWAMATATVVSLAVAAALVFRKRR